MTANTDETARGNNRPEEQSTVDSVVTVRAAGGGSGSVRGTAVIASVTTQAQQEPSFEPTRPVANIISPRRNNDNHSKRKNCPDESCSTNYNNNFNARNLDKNLFARSSAKVASAMGGMVMQGVTSDTDQFGNNTSNSSKSHYRFQQQFSAALVTPEKETPPVSGSPVSMAVSSNNRNEGIDIKTVRNNATATNEEEKYALDTGSSHWYPRWKEKQNTSHQRIITHPNHKSQSSLLQEKPSNTTPSIPRSPQKRRSTPKTSTSSDQQLNFINEQNSSNKNIISSQSRLPSHHRSILPPHPPTGTLVESSPSQSRNERSASDNPDPKLTKKGNIRIHEHWQCHRQKSQEQQQLPPPSTPRKLNQRLLRRFDRMAEQSGEEQVQQPQQQQQQQQQEKEKQQPHRQDQNHLHRQPQRKQKLQHHELPRQRSHEQQGLQQYQYHGIHNNHHPQQENNHLPKHSNPIPNSQVQPYSAANTSASTEDYQFNFDFSEENDDDDIENHDRRSSNGGDENGFGDVDDGFSMTNRRYDGFDGITTTTKAEKDRVTTAKTGNKHCHDQSQGNADDPNASSGGNSFSPTEFSMEWNERVNIYDEERGSSHNGSNIGFSGDDDSGWGAIPMNAIRKEDLHDVYGDFRKRRQKLKETGDYDNNDEDEDEDVWGDWQDPFELPDGRSSTGRKYKDEMGAMISSQKNGHDPIAPSDRTTVVTSNVYISSPKKSALSLSNGKATTRGTIAVLAKPADDEKKIARRIGIDPPSSSEHDSQERGTRLDNTASKTAPDSPATQQTLSSQSSATLSSPKTPQASNTTARASSVAATFTNVVPTKPALKSREQRYQERRECAPSFDEGHSWTTASSSAVSSKTLQSQQEDDSDLHQMQKQEHNRSHPPLPPSSSKASVKPPIISIHGDSSIISDDDSIFSNFSQLRQMRVETNATKNSGENNSLHLNPLNESTNTSLSSIANTASNHDISVGSLDDILDCSEDKNRISAVAGIGEKASKSSHGQPRKPKPSFNVPSFDLAKRTTSTSHPNFRTQAISLQAKTDDKAQAQPRPQPNNHDRLGGDEHAVGDDNLKHKDCGESTNHVENRGQEASRINTSNSDSSVLSSQTLNRTELSRSNPNRPPPHPSPPSASNQRNLSVDFVSPPSCQHRQSPTPSDHSADAAAGAKHAMHARHRIFGDLSDRRSGPDSVNGNGMAEVGKDVRRTHNNLATLIDEESEAKGDSLNLQLDRFPQSTGDESNGDSSPHEDYKSVSSKVSGGIHVQPSFESECLRQNAVIAMEMDDMMAFFHDHHYGVVDFEQNQGEAEQTDTADSMFHEQLVSSRADPSTDSAEAITDRLQPNPNGGHYVSSALIKDDATSHTTHELCVPNLETNQANNQLFNRKAGSHSHRYFSHSNRLSDRLLTDKRHFSCLLSVDEESEFEEPSLNFAANPNNTNLSVKKSLDQKLSEKNELTQIMDTIMRGCYPNDGDNSDVFSYRDENSVVHLAPVEVDQVKGISTPDEEAQLFDQRQSINHSYKRIAKERERIRKEDTTPLRTNTSKAKENTETSEPSHKEDVHKSTQVTESEPMEEELSSEHTNSKSKLPPTRIHSSAQSKLDNNYSVLDEDVVQSYRVTLNSDVLQSYRIRDRQLPAISKLLVKESSAGIDISNKRHTPRNDGDGNKSRDERPPIRPSTEKTVSWNAHQLKTNGYRGAKLPEEPANERDALAIAVCNRNKLDLRRCHHSNNGCLEEDMPRKPDAKEDIMLKISERERNKGRSLAWQSSNGVNGDEEFSPKERLPRAKVNFSRISLLSMVQESATFQEHFRDTRSYAFHLKNPLYNPGSTIREGSHEDSNDENDNQNLGENESIPEYHYDSFVIDFKDILQHEPTSRKDEATQTTREHVQRSKDDGKSNNSSGKNERTNLSRELTAASCLAEKPSNVAMTRAAFENQLRHTTQLPVTGRNHMTLQVEKKKSQVKQIARNSQKTLTVNDSSPTNQSASNPERSHTNNLPSTEVTKSLLEEKLRGLKGSIKKECGNSVTTSELGSLLTRESETSHFVPRCVFHRTHPSSGIDSIRSSPSSTQNTIDNTSSTLAQNKATEALPQSFDNRNFPNRTSKRVRIVLPDLTAPMETYEEREEKRLSETTVASRIRILETHRSLVSDKESRGSDSKRTATNDNKILSSNANAAAAIARIDEELDKMRLHHSAITSATSSDSRIPIENFIKTTRHDHSQDTHAVSDPAGQVENAALKKGTIKVADFWKKMEKSSEASAHLENKQEAVSSSSCPQRNHINTSAINTNRGAEDGSQVSFSEEFEIAPRLQLERIDGHFSDLRVYNVVNGVFPKERKNCEDFTDLSPEDGSFGPIHDVYESSSHHAFEIAPIQRPRLILSPPTEYSCSGPKIPPSRVCELPKQVDSNANTSGGRRPFMKSFWTKKIMQSNNALPAPTKISSTKPITFSTRRGNGSRKKRAEV